MWSLLLGMALAAEPHLDPPALSGRFARIAPVYPVLQLPELRGECNLGSGFRFAVEREEAERRRLLGPDDLLVVSRTVIAKFQADGYRASVTLEDGTTATIHVVRRGADSRDVHVTLAGASGGPVAHGRTGRLTRGDTWAGEVGFARPGEILLRDLPLTEASRLQVHLTDGAEIALWIDGD